MARVRGRAGRLHRLLARVAVPVTLLVLLGWAPHDDPVAELRRHGSPLVGVERAPAPELGPAVERWTLVDGRGRSTRALWRPAPPGDPRPWTVVLLGGAHTGERAALLVPAGLPVNVLAVDWPWPGPRRMGAVELLWRLLGLRRAALRSPAVLALGTEAVARREGVDTSRIALAGASLGALPALAALRLTDRPAAVVLADGAAGLGRLLRHELRPRVRPRALADALAALGARLARPLEPALHAEAALRLPVLLLIAGGDERLPPEAIEDLQHALPWAETRRSPRRHLRSSRERELLEVVEAACAWLEDLGSGTPPPHTPKSSGSQTRPSSPGGPM